MSQALAGKGGKVVVLGTPGTTVALVDNWSATETQQLYDITSLGDNYTSDVQGLKTMTGTIAGKWSVTTDQGQTALHNAIANGATVSLDLYTDGTNSHGYEVTANVDSFQSSDPVNNVVTFSCNFRSTGQYFFI